MRLPRIRTFACVLLVAVALLALTEPLAAKTHILLLDISGSMKERPQRRYNNNMNDWLFEPLLKSLAFEPNDRVIVRWFNVRNNETFQAVDKQRTYDGNCDVQKIRARLPTANDATGDTKIDEALGLVLADIHNLKITGDVLIWLVTDNKQDLGAGVVNADPLYRRIKDNPDFQSAYVFPLTNENHAKLAPDEEAMVMYLLQYSKKPSRPNLNKEADDAGQKIGNVPVTWFPIEKGVDLDENGIMVNDLVSKLVDGRLPLPDVQEGATPAFTLKFPFTSKLKYLRIVESKIVPQKTSSLVLPGTLEVEGDPTSWQGSISPTYLRLEPGKTTKNYTTTLAGQMTFHPASFWDAVWNSTSDPVEATFDYKLVDVDAKMDVSGMNQVQNLKGIESNLRQSQQNVRSRSIPMSFHVQYNSLWRRVVVILVALFLCLLVLGVAGLFLIKSRYQLSTPFSEETLALPLFGSSHLMINGEPAAVIKRRGTLSVTPLGAYTVNGQLQAHRLSQATNSFEIESQVDQKRYAYVLSRATRGPTPPAAGHDPFLD